MLACSWNDTSHRSMSGKFLQNMHINVVLCAVLLKHFPVMIP